MKKITVRVPATTANLGPGFDILGMALTLYNEIEVTVCGDLPWKGKSPLLEISGEGQDVLPRDEKNVVWRSMKKVFDLYPAETKKRRCAAENIAIRLSNAIPLASGLGSSAAARLGGVLAANELLGRKLPQDRIAALASQLEGHSDNVVPALLGGLCVTSMEKDSVEFVQLPCPELKVVVCNPDFSLATEKARKVLPRSVPFRTAVFNSSRVAFLLSAFATGRYGLLDRAMEDKLHQPYRERLIPGMKKVFEAVKKAGAYGAAISGAGPSLAAFVPPAKTGAVARAMKETWKKAGVSSRSFVLDVDCKGAEVR